MAVAMDTTQKVDYTIDGFWADDAHTIPAKVDGPPSCSVVSGSGVHIAQAADGMSGSVVSDDLPQDDPDQMATVEWRADANLDPNVQDFITFTESFVVSSLKSPAAKFMGVTLGAPSPKS